VINIIVMSKAHCKILLMEKVKILCVWNFTSETPFQCKVSWLSAFQRISFLKENLMNEK